MVLVTDSRGAVIMPCIHVCVLLLTVELIKTTLNQRCDKPVAVCRSANGL